LAAHRAEILDDVRSILDGGTAADEIVPELRGLAETACAAAFDGHDAAAQALAAAALGDLIHEPLGHTHFAGARERMADHDLQEASVDHVRYLALERAMANAIIPTARKPEGFNRHGTLHGDPSYYGGAEMLSALLLLAGWTREIAWWAENDPRVFRSA
jgi:hypothetical protein